MLVAVSKSDSRETHEHNARDIAGLPMQDHKSPVNDQYIVRPTDSRVYRTNSARLCLKFLRLHKADVATPLGRYDYTSEQVQDTSSSLGADRGIHERCLG